VDVRRMPPRGETRRRAPEWWLRYMGLRGDDWVGPVAADTVRDILKPRAPLGG